MKSSLLCVCLCVNTNSFRVWYFPFNCSWDHMVKYDLPAMLKFALATTGQPDLFYIGHSQGTIIFFACFSHDLELAKKVRYSFFCSDQITSTLGFFDLFIIEVLRLCCSCAWTLLARDSFIHSLFIYLWKYARHPQPTQPQLGVTRNLKSRPTYVYGENVRWSSG